jgi:hypothetical protein
MVYGRKFEVNFFDMLTMKAGTQSCEVVGQCDGPYGEDFVEVLYEDGAVKDLPISSFIKSIVKELD